MPIPRACRLNDIRRYGCPRAEFRMAAFSSVQAAKSRLELRTSTELFARQMMDIAQYHSSHETRRTESTPCNRLPDFKVELDVFSQATDEVN